MRWDIDEDGDLFYTVIGPPPTNLQAYCNAGMVLVALLADGQRNEGQIYDELIERGLSISDPADVVKVLQTLEQIGAVSMDWHIESLGPLRHTCYPTECGECCEGHLIGPLSRGEVERFIRIREELKTLEPDLEEGNAVMRVEDEGEPVVSIHFVDGRCVFLGRDRLCSIHRHYDMNTKPLICRMFPMRVIETEHGFRVGMTAHCTFTHRSFRNAPPMTPKEAFEAIGLRRPPGAIVGLDPDHIRSFRPTPAFEQNQQQEAFFLSLLTAPQVTFGDVVNSADGTLRLDRPIPEAYLTQVAHRLRRFTKRHQHSPLDTPRTSVGQGIRRLLGQFSQLPATPPAWIEPEKPVREFLLHSLRQFVYLRETIQYPQVEIGVQTAIIGLIGALWTADLRIEADRVSDRLGADVAHWYRIHNHTDSHLFLFDDFDDYLSLKNLLSE